MPIRRWTFARLFPARLDPDGDLLRGEREVAVLVVCRAAQHVGAEAVRGVVEQSGNVRARRGGCRRVAVLVARDLEALRVRGVDLERTVVEVLLQVVPRLARHAARDVRELCVERQALDVLELDAQTV